MYYILWNYETNEGFITPIINHEENLARIMLFREFMDWKYPRHRRWSVIGVLSAINESTNQSLYERD